MNPQDFRRQAHQFVDWMADYLEHVEQYPVRSPVKPGEIDSRLPRSAPQQAQPLEEILADFERDLLPGITHWQHPSFFAYFPANSSPPSLLAEMLTATLGVQGMSWLTSPAATELEVRVMDWLRQAAGLPEGFSGVIQDSASTATLWALLTARERATGWKANDEGLRGAPSLAVYASEEAHSSVEKGLKVAGLGKHSLRRIPADERFAMRPEALERAVAEDLAKGIKPACVVGTLGTTSASGFDPLQPIGELCARHGIYLHVDAAWAGNALLLPEQRWMIDGIERVDSLVFNPHKWLLTNFDCSALFVRDAASLVRTFEILPEYLKTAQGNQVVNFRDWSIPLGRRFRSLKLWFVLRAYGLEGLQAVLRKHIELAQELAEQVKAADDFELLNDPKLALLCLRYHPVGVTDAKRLDELNQRLLDVVNDTGKAFVTHTKLRGAFSIRVCVGQTTTERRHVQALWELVQRTAREMK